VERIRYSGLAWHPQHELSKARTSSPLLLRSGSRCRYDHR
jgi:hypothetical protein